MHADFVDDAVHTLRAAAPGELSRVTEAAAVPAHADDLLVRVVFEARWAGRSWSQIAAALRTSPAIARQRWESPQHGVERGQLADPLGVGAERAGREDGHEQPVHQQVPVDGVEVLGVAHGAAAGAR